jgi:glycosyltransferase involved in cell wall biosynthesis
MYDLIGYFGSRLSYATVAAQIARALADRGLLGTVTNLDDKWLDEYRDLNRSDVPESKHVVIIADTPEWLFASCAQRYGPGHVGIFMSPNTTLLTEERARICSTAGLVLAPSQWCLDTVMRSLERHALPSPVWLSKVPLGVARRYLDVPMRRTPFTGRTRFLHLATDFAWPGRKGTMELLEAWAMVEEQIGEHAELRIHVPFQAYEQVHHYAAALDVRGVEILIAEPRGTTDDDLAKLYEGADVVVLPARCEGFGMMMLAACVSGTPLIAPFVTGQVEFLMEFDGWLGLATSDRMEPMEGEPGFAPVVDSRVLATALVSASSHAALAHLRAGAKRGGGLADGWCWDQVAGAWIEALERWRTT